MSLGKTYDPAAHESDMYALWEQSGAFTPKKALHKDSFTVVLPPPNANGDLHVGHCLMFAIQDAVIRYQRMKGKAALWLPGADHAGFETQVVYEKKLAKEGKSRFDFTRDELYKQVWDFVAQNKENYQSQFRKFGASVDWSRFTFTLDKKIIDQAYQTFKKMWDDGLIYRGERLVNFCTHHGTAFADIEVEYHTEQGKMYYIHFPLVPVEGVKDAKDYILIATTRPETMLGDVAVAVHPEDKRYKHLVGRTVKIPLANREVPVIADEMVDPEFGTGAVKITAAHDPNDFDVAKNHNLPLLRVITEEGTIGHDAPHAYHNLSVEDGRKKVVEDVQALGLLEKIEDHEHRVGHCYKCKTVIQPLVREQWFIDMKPLAEKAIEALKAKKITFYPDGKREQLIRYLQGLRDWNISRQIAWGIPIPAFQNVDDPDDWIFDTRVEQEFIEVNGQKYHRDPDVFDTWFSSSSWPYATLGELGGEDFKQFYPNSLMETGGEILYPWVSRMIMMGLYVTGDIPFNDVYIHGYVLASDGSKMSKSVGNVIDPMAIIDKYGADALRMGLIAGRAPGINRPFDETKAIAGRNFANKLWNVARFIEGVVGDKKVHAEPKVESIADAWMLSKLQHLTEAVGADLDNYRFAEAYERLYHTMWNDFADWYIEASKVEPNAVMLRYALDTILKVAHPFAPFVTEAVWQATHNDSSLLITQSWPTVESADKKASHAFEEVRQIVTETRAIIKAVRPDDTALYHANNTFIAEHAELIAKLARLSSVKPGQGSDESLQLTSSKHRAWLNVKADKLATFKAELKAKITEGEQLANKLGERLGNKAYVEKAPEKLVEQTKQQLEETQTQIELMKAELARFD